MLYIVATPIGNLSDFSARGVETLKSVDIVACEDTRRTRKLMSHFDIRTPRLISYREHNEPRAAQQLLNLMEQGKSVALCTNAGYPGISDPGYRIISQAVAAQLPIQVIPGASAVEIALLLSGLPTSSYTFKGFPPRKPGPLRRFLEAEKDLPHTLVIFESPHRVGKTLTAAHETLGNRLAAVCVELTKKFERVSRGPLEELCDSFRDTPIKGEVTIVIAGNNPKFLAPVS